MRRFAMFLLGFTALVFAGSLVQAATEEEEMGGDKKFTIHGELRFRGEWWQNLTDFTDTDAISDNSLANDSLDLYPYRVRLGARGDLGHDIWVYGEFQAAGLAGGGFFAETSPFFGDDTEVLDGGVNLYQGWIKAKDLGDSVTDLTFGRQEIVFDRGLHFSSLDFYNGISHDGVMGAWDWEDFAIHAFWIRPWESNQVLTALDTSAAADDDTLGVHFTHTLGADRDMDVGYYVFYQLQNESALTSAQDKGTIYTVGGRWGKSVEGKNGFVWNLEAAYQFGDFQPCAAEFTTYASLIFGPPAACLDDPLDQKAFVFEGSGGYVWHSGKTDQKLWIGVTWASGDDDLTDEDQESFQPLYTDFHNRLGYADLFTVTNINAYGVGYKANVDDRHVFGGSLYFFFQDATESGTVSPVVRSFVTGVPLTLVGSCVDGIDPPAGSSCDDELGMEVDIFYDFHLTENFSFDTALSLFDPGQAIEDFVTDFGTSAAFDGGGSDLAYRLTAQARARF